MKSKLVVRGIQMYANKGLNVLYAIFYWSGLIKRMVINFKMKRSDLNFANT